MAKAAKGMNLRTMTMMKKQRKLWLTSSSVRRCMKRAKQDKNWPMNNTTNCAAYWSQSLRCAALKAWAKTALMATDWRCVFVCVLKVLTRKGGPTVLDRNTTTSFWTAVAVIFASGAGITAAGGTKRDQKVMLERDFSFTHSDYDRHGCLVMIFVVTTSVCQVPAALPGSGKAVSQASSPSIEPWTPGTRHCLVKPIPYHRKLIVQESTRGSPKRTIGSYPFEVWEKIENNTCTTWWKLSLLSSLLSFSLLSLSQFYKYFSLLQIQVPRSPLAVARGCSLGGSPFFLWNNAHSEKLLLALGKRGAARAALLIRWGIMNIRQRHSIFFHFSFIFFHFPSFSFIFFHVLSLFFFHFFHFLSFSFIFFHFLSFFHFLFSLSFSGIFFHCFSMFFSLFFLLVLFFLGCSKSSLLVVLIASRFPIKAHRQTRKEATVTVSSRMLGAGWLKSEKWRLVVIDIV